MRTVAVAVVLLAVATPASAGAPGSRKPQQDRAPDRIVWSCQVESLGSPAVMVDFADRTALSTLGAAVSAADVTGDVATWQENDADGIGYRFALDRRTRELRITTLSGPRKGLVRRGRCAPPAPKPHR